MTPNALTFPVEWKLTKSHRIILATLVYSPLEIVTTEALFEALYSQRATDDQPDTRTVGQLLCYLKKRVPDWVQIDNVQGIGYTIKRSTRKRLIAECSVAAEELRTMLDAAPLSTLQKFRSVPYGH